MEAWALKFSYDVDILEFFGHFFQNLVKLLFNFLVTLARSLPLDGHSIRDATQVDSSFSLSDGPVVFLRMPLGQFLTA